MCVFDGLKMDLKNIAHIFFINSEMTCQIANLTPNCCIGHIKNEIVITIQTLLSNAPALSNFEMSSFRQNEQQFSFAIPGDFENPNGFNNNSLRHVSSLLQYCTVSS